MKRILFVLYAVVCIKFCVGQTVSERLKSAFAQFENDPQLKAAISSLYVLDNKTGKVVFEKNSAIGLAPASTQKVITSASAYELLGKEFRYKTEFGLSANRGNNAIVIKPSGDPTLGSWRWEGTKEKATVARINSAIRKSLSSYSQIQILNEGWNYETIPDGWIWQDIGNYYGAGAGAFIWRENQFDLVLNSGKNIGEKVEVVRTEPKLHSYQLTSSATAAAKGSGDNAFIYFPLNSSGGVVRGTIPVNESAFRISGAIPSADKEFVLMLDDVLKDLKATGTPTTSSTQSAPINVKIFHTELSPPLDSIIYWFNRKSINLYGEALMKTFGFNKGQQGSTEKGVELVKELWKSRGIPSVELNIVDGSGLSPLNRLTTKAQAQVLQYAKKQAWFAGFYLSLPEFNGMKMKSGTIQNVKAFTGYHTSSSGDYIYSFIVNNYNGSSATLVQKMYQVLNELK